jgi:butyrate kinase
MKRILAINPGSTSTKIAVYDDETLVLGCSIKHSVEELSSLNGAEEHYEYRKRLILSELERHNIPLRFDAVIGRGGLVKPIEGGVYEVNEAMRRDTIAAKRRHACNLGCLIAAELASMIGCRAFMADPGVVDEMYDICHITGSPLMPRITTWHALNQRAIARRYAREHATDYEHLRLVVCHLGGGISIGTHCEGRAVDVNNAFDGEGPFSPERAGTLPTGALIDLCYSGRFTKEELKSRISGHAGLAAHLGTTDMIEIEKRIAAGDKHAEQVVDAMIYQTAKAIGAAAVPLFGRVDAILLTGGIAHSAYVIPRLTRYIEHIAPVHVYPGEDELLALAQNAIGALDGSLTVKEYR